MEVIGSLQVYKTTYGRSSNLDLVLEFNSLMTHIPAWKARNPRFKRLSSQQLCSSNITHIEAIKVYQENFVENQFKFGGNKIDITSIFFKMF